MIVIDASPAVHHKAGLARYTEDLIGALSGRGKTGRYGVFFHDRARATPSAMVGSLPTLASPLGPYRWRLRALLAQLTNFSQDREVDPRATMTLFHATEHLLPRIKRAATVFTLHDLIFRAYPRFHLPRNWIYLQLAMPIFLRRATRVICVSDWTRRDAERLYGLRPDKTAVVHEGVHARFRPVVDPAARAAARAKYGLPERFLLALGTIEPRKNLLTLFDSLARLDDAALGVWAGVPLVVGGRQGWLTESTFAAVKARGLEGRVHFTGFVEDVDLPAVLSQAALFCFPSLYEGFGLPPLEAMACGVPTLSSHAASLPEVLGDAAEYVAPDDAGEWAAAITRLLTDESARQALAARGPERAGRFTWTRAADKTEAVYASALSGFTQPA